MTDHPEGKERNSTPVRYGTTSFTPGLAVPVADVQVGGSAPNIASWPSNPLAEGIAETIRGGTGAGQA